MKTIKYGFSLLRPYLWQSIFCFFLSLLTIGISIFLPQVCKFVIDYVLDPQGTAVRDDFITKLILSGNIGGVGTKELLIALLSIFVCFTILKMILQYFKGVYQNRYGNRFHKDIRMAGFKKLMQSNKLKSSADLYLILSHDAFALKELFLIIIPQFFYYVCYAFIALVLVFFTHWVVGLTIAISLPIFVCIDIVYVRHTTKYFKESRSKSMDLSSAVQEGTSAIKDIKAFSAEEKEITFLQNRNEEYLGNKISNVKTANKFQFLIQLTRAIFYSFGIVVSSVLAIKGSITIGEFSLLVSYCVMVLDNINNSVGKFYHAEEMWVYSKIFRSFVQGKNKIANNKTKDSITHLPNIEATNLTLSLQKRIVLDKVSFRIPYGKTVGFFAPLGEGKSVLSDALLRFMDPTFGGLSINNVDYKEINTDSIRDQFSFVPQTPFVFCDTIRENVVMFADGFDKQKYDKIFDLLGLTNFINKLPEKDLTILKENGAGFPSQQTALISLARALYRDAPIVLLDSPIERFEEGEGKTILSNIINYEKNKTVILLSSDPNEFVECDMIFAIKNGSIVEAGTYESLLKKGEYFASCVVSDEKIRGEE